jgi:hypothetical protein
MPRVHYLAAVEESGVLETLAAFHPHIAGTPPLAIDVEGSDIDVLCDYADACAFTRVVVDAYATATAEGFRISQWRAGTRAIVARFHAAGWPFEIFAQTTPVHRQMGWRHFLVEKRLLDLGVPELRTAVVAAKRSGRKTEPAFADLLKLDGNPYEALLALEQLDDNALHALLRRAGF